MGATSEPCCISDPMVNQKLLAKLNWFSNSSGSSMHGYGLSHSKGDSLANTKRTRETKTRPNTVYNHTSAVKGDMKESRLGGA